MARATKPACAPNTKSAQNDPTGQEADAKTLFNDENSDEGVASDDDDSMDGGPDNEGEHMNDDDDGDAAGDADSGDDAETDDEGGGRRGANERLVSSDADNFRGILPAVRTVFLTASRLRRVHLRMVRTQPSRLVC